jgi:23S rRNA (guanosine2251-2'-O)-methyltransferase
MTDERNSGSPKDRHYANLRRAHRDAKRAGGQKSRNAPAPQDVPDGVVRLYGLHTVRAAIDNPRRKVLSMQVTRNALQRLGFGDVESLPFPVTLAEPREIDALVGSDAVHQGVTMDARALKPRKFSELGEASLVLVLDQITDPHNAGAIMRSAVAFGADALVTTARHSPHESGVLAKSASGALEHIDLIEVRNLAEALEDLAAQGFQTIGLDSDGPEELERSITGSRIALVLGAEGKGLRQKTRDTVTTLARLEMPGAIRSLNVSNAAAIALYIANSHLRARSSKPG